MYIRVTDPAYNNKELSLRRFRSTIVNPLINYSILHQTLAQIFVLTGYEPHVHLT